MLAVLSLFVIGCSEADTVYPGDETYYNTNTPIGAVTSLTATASDLTVANPYITITFSKPIDTATIGYGTTVFVEYPTGTPRTVVTDYIGVTNSNKIIIDFLPIAPVTLGQTATITLTTGITSDLDTTVPLSGTLVFTCTVVSLL